MGERVARAGRSLAAVAVLGFGCGSPAGDPEVDARARADASPPDAYAARCGNGALDEGEFCDDGNSVEDDECANDCTPTAPFAEFHATIEDFMSRWGLTGGVVALSDQGRLVMVRGYGIADLESEVLVQRTNRFRIASMSKTVTAVAIMKLVEGGLLDLDAPAFSYLPKLRPPKTPNPDPRFADVTIRQLLQHTGGWDRAISGEAMFDSIEIAEALHEPPPATAEMIIRYMLSQPLDHDPGERFAYSGFGYTVLGRVIEAVTGEPYESWVQANVLAPMGIEGMQSGATRLEDRAEGEVHYYGAGSTTSVFTGEGFVPMAYGGFYLEAMDASGGWIASAIDYTRFVLGIDGLDTYPDLLQPDSKAILTERPNVADWADTAYWYAMGMYVRPHGSGINSWHSGSLPGTSARWVSYSAGRTIVALFNQRPDDPYYFTDFADSLWDAYQAVSDWPEYDLFERY